MNFISVIWEGWSDVPAAHPIVLSIMYSFSRTLVNINFCNTFFLIPLYVHANNLSELAHKPLQDILISRDLALCPLLCPLTFDWKF